MANMNLVYFILGVLEFNFETINSILNYFTVEFTIPTLKVIICDKYNIPPTIVYGKFIIYDIKP
jgi:hypothetical protein